MQPLPDDLPEGVEADGKTPASFEYNVAVTKEVVEYAHARGVTVEGELGTLGGIEDGHGSGEVHLTDPDQAVEFVERSGCDSLAVAIGTSHGAYKFSGSQGLHFDRIAEILVKVRPPSPGALVESLRQVANFANQITDGDPAP